MKIETLLSKLPFVLFCSYVVKSIILSTTTPTELGIISILACITGFLEYKQVDKSYLLLQEKHKTLEIEVLDIKEDLKSIKGALTSVKLTQGPRSSFGGKI